jgi:FixJ family two-component response regulator
MIAIVDDDDAVRDGAAQLVQSMGYSTSTFASAEEFLNTGRVHNTSCVIADVQMPGLSGIELQCRLIARGHRIPIIFMTGYPDERVRIRAMEAGAVGFLSKPFSPDHLLGCLEKALRLEARSRATEDQNDCPHQAGG